VDHKSFHCKPDCKGHASNKCGLKNINNSFPKSRVRSCISPFAWSSPTTHNLVSDAQHPWNNHKANQHPEFVQSQRAARRCIWASTCFWQWTAHVEEAHLLGSSNCCHARWHRIDRNARFFFISRSCNRKLQNMYQHCRFPVLIFGFRCYSYRNYIPLEQ
jgi:hypothetical protein